MSSTEKLKENLMDGILKILASIVGQVNDKDLNECFECVNTKLSENSKVEVAIEEKITIYQAMISDIAAGQKINLVNYSLDGLSSSQERG